MNDKEVNIQLLNLEVVNLEKAIGLCDKILDLVPKFDGKVVNKRFDTALKEIDKSLSFSMRYNSFIIEMYKQDRSINRGDSWSYLRDHSLCIIHSSIQSAYNDGICQDGQHIVGANLVADIQKQKKYFEDNLVKLKNDIADIDSIQEVYKDIQQQKTSFNNNVSYMVREYFGFDFKR